MTEWEYLPFITESPVWYGHKKCKISQFQRFAGSLFFSDILLDFTWLSHLIYNSLPIPETKQKLIKTINFIWGIQRLKVTSQIKRKNNTEVQLNNILKINTTLFLPIWPNVPSLWDWFEHFIMRESQKYLGYHPFQAFYNIQYLSQCFVLYNIYQDNLSPQSKENNIRKLLYQCS